MDCAEVRVPVRVEGASTIARAAESQYTYSAERIGQRTRQQLLLYTRGAWTVVRGRRNVLMHMRSMRIDMRVRMRMRMRLVARVYRS